ncbi:MAG: plastocyanin/azurin family copper-binding protein [Nitrososphaerales archaeon]
MVSRRTFVGSVVGAAVVAGGVGYMGGTMTSSSPARGIDPIYGFAAPSSAIQPPKAPDHTVQLLLKPRPPIPIPEFFFEPTGLVINPGDTVMFRGDTPDHTVTAFHPGFGFRPRVPDGVPAFTSPVIQGGGYWLYTFEKEGVYDVYCAPHQILGMVARIIVGSATGPGTSEVPPPSPSEEPPFHPLFGAALVFRDPAMSTDNILSKGMVKWDDIQPQNKIPLLAPTGGPPGGGPGGPPQG